MKRSSMCRFCNSGICLCIAGFFLLDERPQRRSLGDLSLLDSTANDKSQGVHSLLFLPEQVPYRDDSNKAFRPIHVLGLFLCSLSQSLHLRRTSGARFEGPLMIPRCPGSKPSTS